MKGFKKISGALSVVLLSVAFAASATYLVAPEDERVDIAEMVVASEDDSQERQIDWDALPPEVIAWVEVPGTSIDEPIVQATLDAPNAYLHMDALGQGAYGTPYIDCECTLETPFVMIYGHHMSDGSVFADFASFVDEAYALGHQKIFLYQRDGETLELRVLAVDVVNASRERLITDQTYDLNSMAEKADLRFNQTSTTSQLFAFATCSYQTDNSRTVVYASEFPDSGVQ